MKLVNLLVLRKYKYAIFIAILMAFTAFPIITDAAEAAAHGEGHGASVTAFLFLGVLLLAAKIGGIVEKFGLPSVLGELFAGIVLSALAYFGLHQIEEIRTNEIISFFAQFGAVLLLFQVGLESNIRQLVSVGMRSLIVAAIGVVTPFILGSFVIGPIFFPEASFAAHLFIGASIVATSVGITASVFKALGVSKSKAAQTVIGAAVVDDILGLLLLAVVSSLATSGELNPQEILMMSLSAFAFLGFAIAIGNYLAEPISWLFSKINTGTGMKLGLVVIIALLYAYAATLFGLEPILGAFAAGLILDAVYFKSFALPAFLHDLEDIKALDTTEEAKIQELKHKVEHTHIEDMVESIAMIFVPLFFTFTGLQIEFASLLNPNLYFVAFIVSLVAIISKVVAGFGAQGSMNEKLLIGFSMVPRGEVGLIFLSVGKALGAIDNSIFSTLLIVVVATTFIAPFALKVMCDKTDLAAAGLPAQK